MLIMLFAPYASNAGEITVGNGTSNTNIAPFKNTSAYSWVEMIYQSNEIGQACEITSLSYQCVTAGFFGAMTATEIKVYLAEVSKSELATNNFTPESDLTLVYTGTNVVIGDEEWETLTLDIPFNYSGENNLVIVVSKSAYASNLNLRWTCSTVDNGVLFDFHDTDPIGAAFPSENSFMGGAGSINNQRPIVKLGITGEVDPDNDETEVTEGDTWQNAIIVTEYPFSSTPDYANLNNDYTLPGETQDGADAVYKLTFAGETTLSAAVEGANGKLALYADDFNGENGPGPDNYYVENEDPEDPDDGEYSTTFSDNFNGNLNNWRTFQNDDDNYNWEIGNTYGMTGPDNSACIYSLAYADTELLPDNYIVTKSKYSITATSSVSFYVRPMNYSYIFDTYGVVISEDNESWTVVYSESFDENTEQDYVLKNIDLSSYAGKNLYIGLRHYDSDGTWATGVLADDFVLSDGNKRNGDNTLDMTVPAGVYYLVASATEAFTVNINVDGGAQLAKVSFEAEVLGGTSVKTTARPNEFTVEYHYSIFEATEVESAGIETLAEELREDETPYTEIDIWTWTELTPLTDYYLIGTAKNAQGEWGPTTYVTFKTTEDQIDYDTAEVTVEITSIDAESVVVETTINEATKEYHIGVITKALFEYLGESVVIESVRNDGKPHTGNNEHTFGDLNPLTEYCIIISPNNEGDEWGVTTIENFTTDEVGLAELNKSVSVYPNPASSLIYVEYENNAEVSFIDIAGRCVKRVETSGNTTIDVRDLEKGLYIMKIQDGDNTMIQRVVVK